MKAFIKLLFLFAFTVSVLLASDDRSAPIISHGEKAKNYGSFLDSYIKSRKAYPPKVYDFLLEYVEKDEPILDIGCGTGLSTAQLMVRFNHVRGCDIDERMLEEARKLDPDLFDHADIYDLPYLTESFRLVTAFDVFHWCCDQNSAKEIARVLKPNGFFYTISTMQIYTESSFRGKVAKVIEEVLGYPFENSKQNFHPEEVLTQNDFEILYSENMIIEKLYTAEEALSRLKGSNDTWSPILKSGKEQEVTERLQELIKANLDENGKITEISTLNIIFAKKKS